MTHWVHIAFQVVAIIGYFLLMSYIWNVHKFNQRLLKVNTQVSIQNERLVRDLKKLTEESTTT